MPEYLVVLTLITANIRGYPTMLQKMVRADLVKLDRRQPDILATQEMWKWRYRRGLRRVFGDYRHNTGRNRSTALSMRGPTFELVRKYALPLHRGYPAERLDARQMAVMVLRDRITGIIVTAICVHYGPKRVAEDHRHIWTDGTENVLAVVREQLRLGRLVVVLGDTNQHGPIYGHEVNGHRVQYATDGDDIDKIVVFDSNDHEWVLLGEEAESISLFSDHDGKRRDVAIRARRKAA